MTSKEVLEKLTIDDIINIVISLGGVEPREVSQNEYLFKTFCHNESHKGKYKLSYYVNSKTFVCWTECGTIGNIFNLVMHIKHIDFKEAFNYVCEKTGIIPTTLREGFTKKEEKDNFSFIKKFSCEDLENIEIEKLNEYDDSVLNTFYNFYHISWIKDHITIETMKEFNIKFDVLNNGIIIPHYDKDDRLVGIRARFLNEDMEREGKKYMPITLNSITYKYPLRFNLYGLNKHLDNIKKYKTIILGEAEKFVLQHHSFYPKTSTAVGLNGSSLHWEQVKIIKDLGVDNIIIALDKEFSNKKEEIEYKNKIKEGLIDKLYPIFNVFIIWDRFNVLSLKSSPTDNGKEAYEFLFKNKLYYTI